MPRQAILSDIHGNKVALDRALADCKLQEVDEIVCLGDIVGYGADPVDCVDLVRKHCKWALCGNHDVALFLPFAVGFNKIARQAIDYHKSVLKPHWYSLPSRTRRWRWLENLTPRKEIEDVLYVHASPRDPVTEYIEEGDVADMGFGPSEKIIEIFEKMKWLCFCGHSHKPGVVTQDYFWIKPHELEDMTYRLTKGQKTVVNVGSVGQPRDGNPDSCYVIFDTDKNLITYRRVPYDVTAAQARFKGIAELHERCWQRLETAS